MLEAEEEAVWATYNEEGVCPHSRNHCYFGRFIGSSAMEDVWIRTHIKV